MAETVQILCIRKTDRTEPHERIEGVGGVNPDHTRWYLTEDQAIAYIEDGTHSFYVHTGLNSVWVVVAERLGRKYLKTQPDGVPPDTLLRLPECPP